MQSCAGPWRAQAGSGLGRAGLDWTVRIVRDATAGLLDPRPLILIIASPASPALPSAGSLLSPLIFAPCPAFYRFLCFCFPDLRLAFPPLPRRGTALSPPSPSRSLTLFLSGTVPPFPLFYFLIYFLAAYEDGDDSPELSEYKRVEGVGPGGAGRRGGGARRAAGVRLGASGLPRATAGPT